MYHAARLGIFQHLALPKRKILRAAARNCEIYKIAGILKTLPAAFRKPLSTVFGVGGACGAGERARGV
jgi:hypothetical protein